mmetsp:Transcript_600/g.1255  ORF Transcript_600/g.1255 Transcript_600/m.1255 type:complete len:250 (+) Transcript_600:3920-4669(+)
MQRRLPVEDHAVVVLHLPLYHIPVVQNLVRGRLHKAQIHTLAIAPNNRFRARMLVGPVVDEHLHVLDVVPGDDLGEGHVPCDRARDSDLVAADGRVASDDSARREVHALPHQVPSHPTLLALDALAEALDGLAVAMLRLRLPCDLVVVHGGQVVLEEHLALANHRRRQPALQLVAEGVVGLDDVAELEGDVVLAARPPVRHDRRPHVRRRHRHHRDHHPVRAGEAGVEAEVLAVLVRNALQNLQRLLRK